MIRVHSNGKIRFVKRFSSKEARHWPLKSIWLLSIGSQKSLGTLGGLVSMFCLRADRACCILQESWFILPLITFNSYLWNQGVSLELLNYILSLIRSTWIRSGLRWTCWLHFCKKLADPSCTGNHRRMESQNSQLYDVLRCTYSLDTLGGAVHRGIYLVCNPQRLLQ